MQLILRIKRERQHGDNELISPDCLLTILVVTGLESVTS